MADTEEKAAETETKPAAPVKPRKHKLPDGWSTPVEFHHHLVDNGHAPATMNTAQIYILSRNAKSNGMPVKHFDAAGKEYDELQTNEHGHTTTRPGVKIDEATEWWINRPKRAAGGQKKKDDEAKDGEAPAEGADAAAPVENELDEGFDEEDEEEGADVGEAE
jgi:hypothetical protein